ncbi:MAG: tRNA (adenosine(37)-N6)-threonylcarbamoyltransferase complex transferase subunit TsaD [Candidatus Omnitrophota bacterium]
MNILGIETSCDETAAAVVKDGQFILSNIVASSLNEHKKYGGIIPEIASRHQLEWIKTVVEKSLSKAKVRWSSIQAIALTQSPGLMGSLLVGISFARALSYATHKPLIEVDHIKAHLYANFLRKSEPSQRPETRRFTPPALPAIGLVVSGGHTSLFHIKTYKKFELVGQTRDDAAGEAFDKVARILKLGYPGGPIIDRLAKRGESPHPLRFPCADLPDSYDFSFSGIKTAVLYYQQAHQGRGDFSIPKIANAFQASIVSILIKKCISLCLRKKIKTLVVGGGVASNSSLREKLTQAGKENAISVFFPRPELCLDNAAMVAGLGYHLFHC